MNNILAPYLPTLLKWENSSAYWAFLANTFDDLDELRVNFHPLCMDMAIKQYTEYITQVVKYVERYRRNLEDEDICVVLSHMICMMRKARLIPTLDHELVNSLCKAFLNCEGLKWLVSNLESNNNAVKYLSADLLKHCLNEDNTNYVVENDNISEEVLKLTCSSSSDHSRINIGILECLFMHSEIACDDIVRHGGLDKVLYQCRSNDVETLRHCAKALANFSLYGGTGNQKKMIEPDALEWLFPLAFYDDDDIVKYYACLTLVALVSNEELEEVVLKCDTFDLVEKFVVNRDPCKFAESSISYDHSRSKTWPEWLWPLKNVDRIREKVRYMVNHNSTEFGESGYWYGVNQTRNWLQRLVPLLCSKREEARNIAAFHFCVEASIRKAHSGRELFAQIGATEGLKKISSHPSSNSVASKFAARALTLVGEDVRSTMSDGLTSEDSNESTAVRLSNSIRQMRMSNSVEQNFDIFISYRRSNGSHLASLLKVHLTLQKQQVFLDVNTLRAGKFDENILRGIEQSKNFLLVLTPNALDRCIGDFNCEDWIHKEVVTAIKSHCNIIPITYNFCWPEPNRLPEDMRSICRYNGIDWVHNYQDACLKKIVEFIAKGSD